MKRSLSHQPNANFDRIPPSVLSFLYENRIIYVFNRIACALSPNSLQIPQLPLLPLVAAVACLSLSAHLQSSPAVTPSASPAAATIERLEQQVTALIGRLFPPQHPSMANGTPVEDATDADAHSFSAISADMFANPYDYWALRLLIILVGYASVLLPGFFLIRFVKRRYYSEFCRYERKTMKNKSKSN